jgi:nickel transport protein
VKPLLLLICFCPFLAQAHGLQYAASQGEAVVLRLFHADGSGLSFAAYEIRRADEDRPYQLGRTDGQGRIAFLPDQAGGWRLKVASEDGHGLDIRFTTDATARLSGLDRPFHERHARILAGVGLILGLFGFLMLFLRRKPSP